MFAHERAARDLQHAQEMCNTRFFWVVNYLSDYTGFDFLWEPVPWEKDQRHVWPSQWQVDGGTCLVPKQGFNDTNYHSQVVPRKPMSDVIMINHGNNNSVSIECFKQVRFANSYLDTLRRICNTATQSKLWIVSSVCDYKNFDFSWHPEPWQDNMIHVFASDEQKFGDTFYLDVAMAKQSLATAELLDWAPVNFVSDISVPRHHVPVNWHQRDSHVQSVKQHEFSAPIELFTCVNIDQVDIPTVSLWREQSQTITPLSKGASSVLVPQRSIPYIKTQLYDYPYINKTYQDRMIDQPQDVVFISNGEPMAEENWQTLVKLCPRARRSEGVTGREAAYKAAARSSTTPWFFAVFAKTEVLPEFAFDFQPDRMQQPKHYIFHSRNPLNGLEYGAMNINLYNRQLVLDTVPGLDFTLSAAHTVVPIVASISRFNTDPWITWRSAFRETMKLRREVDLGADIEIEHRLEVWCTKAQGQNAEYCLQGAQDGVDYYQSVNGDLEMLKLSFDWQWCQDYYRAKYGRELWLES